MQKSKVSPVSCLIVINFGNQSFFRQIVLQRESYSIKYDQLLDYLANNTVDLDGFTLQFRSMKPEEKWIPVQPNTIIDFKQHGISLNLLLCLSSEKSARKSRHVKSSPAKKGQEEHHITMLRAAPILKFDRNAPEGMFREPGMRFHVAILFLAR